MLPEKNRIVAKKEFRKINKFASKSKGSFLSIRFIANKRDYPRFAFVVSNAVVPKAAQRNLIKRRMRAIIFRELDRIKPGFDVILKMERRTSTEIPKYQDFENDAKGLLERVGLFK